MLEDVKIDIMTRGSLWPCCIGFIILVKIIMFIVYDHTVCDIGNVLQTCHNVPYSDKNIYVIVINAK